MTDVDSMPDSMTSATIAAVDALNDAFDRQDADQAGEHITDDVVWETTDPAPDGSRHQGREAVVGAWKTMFGSAAEVTFDVEEQFACGDRAAIRWIYRWVDRQGGRGHIRGIDMIRVRDGKVCEILSYVKG